MNHAPKKQKIGPTKSDLNPNQTPKSVIFS
jgi:hypothetical protein